MTIRHTSAALLVLGILLSLSPSTHAQDFDDSISGPRRQLSVTAGFNGDTMFKQPVRGVSQTNGETPSPITGSGWVISVSGYVMLPHGQHLLKVQIVNGFTDPVRSEVLATLDYALIAVTPDGSYYARSLRGPCACRT